MPQARRTVIGYYGFTQAERTPRLLSGILKYRREQGGIELHHYLIDVYKTFSNDAPPPWKGKVDGILIGLHIAGDFDGVIEWVRSGGVPAVSMASNILDPRYPIVIADQDGMARTAVRELLRCKCRSLLFTGFLPSVGSGLRGDAFERAAEARGLPCARLDSTWDFSQNDPEDPSENAELARLLTSQPRPVGVHALNDSIGRRIVRICQKHQLGIPEDVALVAADDTPRAFELRPTLTSICFPGEELAFRATELLHELIAGGRPPKKPVLVPAREMAVRESTGGTPEPDHVIRALEVIRRKAPQGLKVDDLAASVNVNRRTLERAFHERLGRPPAFEIQLVRMAAARELLTETEFPIGQIATLVGYAEQAAFCNAFRREMGVSPREFRRLPKLGKSQRKP